MFKNTKRIFIFFVLLAGFFLTANFALAGVDVGASFGAKTGLSAVDPRIIIARIIQIALGFLGIIAIGLIIYGGFLWMTSSGDENQVQKAKDVLRNAIIGLIIILSAFGIATFVLSRIMNATGNGSVDGGSGSVGIGGSGVLGACSVESVYPTPDQREVSRNTSIVITFKEEIDPATICATVTNNHCEGSNIINAGNSEDWPVRIYKSGDEASALRNFKVYDNDNKTFVFVPGEYLGSPSEYLWYSAYFGNSINTIAGKPIFRNCSTDYMRWQFEVSNKIDLNPPQVLERGVFPSPDNNRDNKIAGPAPVQAGGSITLTSQPNIYKSASASSPIKNTPASPDVEVLIDKNSTESGTLRATVANDDVTVELYNGTRPLGVAVFSNRTATFKGILSLRLPTADPARGNSWDIPVVPFKKADTLTVGRIIYVFVATSSAPNQIKIGANLSATADNITAAINSSHLEVGATRSGSVINIKALLAGAKGNNIAIGLNPNNLSFLTGGVDRDEKVQVLGGRKDQPINTVIQINFNEAILPMTVTGAAADVQNYIRVVNADPGALAEGAACSGDAQCLSFKCTSTVASAPNTVCVGSNNYLPGNFKISNQYKTVEFVSDVQCGVNGCGDPIYCLPKNSQLRVDLLPADLTPCASNNDCVSKSPYNTCTTTPQTGSLRVCRQDFGDSRTRNYPTADIGSLNGVMDASFNSFDGDRNSFAEGPITGILYSDNPPVYSANKDCQADFTRIINNIKSQRVSQNKVLRDIADSFNEKDFGGAAFSITKNEYASAANPCIHDTVSSINCASVNIPFYFCAEGDNYSWYFFIGDKMEITPPELRSIIPSRGSTNIQLGSEISGVFSKIMMSSTLSTGETIVVNGDKNIIHKNVNFWSLSNKAVGYWTESELLDIDSNGEFDQTKVFIKHNLLDESISYRSQIGSGLKDIYQNCYKPSSGPDCLGTVNENNPSCCNGAAAAVLGSDGNCN